MENATPQQTDQVIALLAQRLASNRADLITRYHQSLQKTLFSNRSVVRPRELGHIAADEADMLISTLPTPLPAGVKHGIKLCEMGLSEQTILDLGQATRRFILTIFESDLIPPAMDATDTYQNAVVQGFIQTREKLILSEQERIRGALQIAIGRYTVEIKEVQEMAQKATEANEFKTKFIARISHELRTPLGALMGMAEMLQKNVYGPLTTAQQDIAQRIVNNAQALNQVFAELLDQAQIESGKLHLKKEKFSPQALTQRVHSNYLSLALQKGLTLHIELDPELPPTLVGDHARIEQILSNLVVNAIKFTKSGGVTVHVFRKNDTYWVLQVKDTGVGISAEDQAYIFEPFRQADETTSRKYGGVGLGLSIVHELTKVMNGSISLESKFGQGSVFTVTLPIQEKSDI